MPTAVIWFGALPTLKTRWDRAGARMGSSTLVAPSSALAAPISGSGSLDFTVSDCWSARAGVRSRERIFGAGHPPSARKLAVANLRLQGIGVEDSDSPIVVDDELRADPGDRFDMVSTNPRFGLRLRT